MKKFLESWGVSSYKEAITILCWCFLVVALLFGVSLGMSATHLAGWW